MMDYLWFVYIHVVFLIFMLFFYSYKFICMPIAFRSLSGGISKSMGHRLLSKCRWTTFLLSWGEERVGLMCPMGPLPPATPSPTQPLQTPAEVPPVNSLQYQVGWCCVDMLFCVGMCLCVCMGCGGGPDVPNGTVTTSNSITNTATPDTSRSTSSQQS